MWWYATNTSYTLIYWSTNVLMYLFKMQIIHWLLKSFIFPKYVQIKKNITKEQFIVGTFLFIQAHWQVQYHHYPILIHNSILNFFWWMSIITWKCHLNNEQGRVNARSNCYVQVLIMKTFTNACASLLLSEVEALMIKYFTKCLER